MSDMESLISKEIPEMRKELLKSHFNLSQVFHLIFIINITFIKIIIINQVADYCVNNYKSPGHKSKHQVLDETKKITTRALAAVAFQVYLFYFILIFFFNLMLFVINFMLINVFKLLCFLFICIF